VPEQTLKWSKAVQHAHKMNLPLKCEHCGGEVHHFAQINTAMHAFIVGPDGKFSPLTRDHIMPKSFGGTYARTNIRLLCEYCNGRRGNNATIMQIVAGVASLLEHRRVLLHRPQRLSNQPKRLAFLQPQKLLKQLRCCGNLC
jgi:hypothetical protein